MEGGDRLIVTGNRAIGHAIHVHPLQGRGYQRQAEPGGDEIEG
jgi:hypothetical protein